MGGEKMLRGMVVALMLVWLSSSADAVVLLRDYKAAKADTEKKLNKIYLGGVKEGVVMFDAELAVEGRQRLFCMPDNLSVTFDQAENIMMREAQKRTDPDNVPISLLLINGLKDTFPCQH
jgi:hypothetical protein